jgi:RNA polymerase sigma factor (sigma-70 family)
MLSATTAMKPPAATKESGVSAPDSSAPTLSWYLELVGRTPLRTAEEEIDLAKRVRAGSAAARLLAHRGLGRGDGTGRLAPAEVARLRRVVREGRRSTAVLIEANLRLVVSMAKRYRGRGLDLPDLVQEGNLGLITAVERYDPGRGFRFSTYASWWIRQAIVRGLATRGRPVRLPVHAYEVLSRLRQAELDLWQQHGRSPTEAELAAAVGLTTTRLREIRRASRDLISLDRPVGEDGDTTLGALMADVDAPGPDERLLADATMGLIEAALASLRPRDREVLERRFGLAGRRPQTLEEIGSDFGLTRERIRQIELRALDRLARTSRGGLVDAVGA